MKKMRIIGICALLLLGTFLDPVPVGAEESVTEEPEETSSGTDPVSISSPSAILMEPVTGKILYEKNAHEQLRPASVTKIMTILLAMEAVRDGRANLTDMVTVSANAAGYGGSTILLEEGEQISLENLIKGMCIASGNDAAIAASEYIGGSQEGFVELMNTRAKELGMEDTHFVNPCGLDADGHVTSAHDIAVMSRELITNFPEILEYTSIWHEMMPHVWRSGTGETDMANTNKLIRSYEGMRGLKTGFTRLAKYSLSAVAERNGLTFIAVIMGAETKDIRSEEICSLLDYGFGKYEMGIMETDGQEAGYVEISGGIITKVPVTICGNVCCLLSRGESLDAGQLETQMNVPEDLKAPIAAGDTVGSIVYLKDGEVIAELPLVSTEGVEEAAWSDRVKQLLNVWATCG